MSCLLRLLFPFMEVPVNGKKIQKTLLTIFSSLILLHCLLQSSYYNFLRSFQIFLFLTNLTQMPSLDRYEKVTCEKCGTQTTKQNLARHKGRCSVGTLYCTQHPNFSTQLQSDLKYLIAMKHSAPNQISPSSVNFEFPSFSN